MDKTFLTLSGTFLIALVGYFIKYLHDMSLQRRRDNLNYLEKQIGEFYGPLYILGNVGITSYNALIKKMNKENDRRLNVLTAEQKQEWRIWLENVFMPNNLEMEKIIKEKAYLIKEAEIPSCFIEFITHVADYKVVLAKWKQDNYSNIFSFIDFPDELHKYIEYRFLELRTEQISQIKNSK